MIEFLWEVIMESVQKVQFSLYYTAYFMYLTMFYLSHSFCVSVIIILMFPLTDSS